MMILMTQIKGIDAMRSAALTMFLLLCLSIPVVAAETVLTATDADGEGATLTLSQSPLLSMTPTELRLTLNKAHGDMMMLSSAVCDLTMPEMAMPENRPTLECDPVGCRGSAIFTMAGAWDVACDVTFSSGKSSRFLFVIDMVQMK